MIASSQQQQVDVLALLGQPSKPTNQSVHRYLVLPSRASPRWILPMANRAVASASMRLYMPATIHGRLVKKIVAMCLRYAILPGHVIGIDMGSESPLFKEIMTRCGAPISDTFIAISLGTPGRNQKKTVQVMHADGATRAYVKLADQIRPKASLRREAEILESLRSHGITGSVPSLVYSGDFGDFYLLIQTSGQGKPCGISFGTAHWAFLEQLLVSQTTSLSEHASEVSMLHDQIQRRSEVITAEATILFNRVLAHMQTNQCESFRGAISHGDFAPWNMQICDEASGPALFVYDWEQGRALGLPFFDAIHYFVQTGILVHRRPISRLVDDTLRALNTTNSQHYLRSSGITPALLGSFLALYLTEIILNDVELEGQMTSHLQLKRLGMLQHLLSAGLI
jgi:hypothetical protein